MMSRKSSRVRGRQLQAKAPVISFLSAWRIWLLLCCRTSTTARYSGFQVRTHRTQLNGDWAGARTDLARHGLFFDVYSTSAYQDVASGGLQTGGASIQNTQLSINIDTGRAGLWSGGLFHLTLESRYGSSSPQNTTEDSYCRLQCSSIYRSCVPRSVLRT